MDTKKLCESWVILLDNIGNNKENAKINILNLAEKIKDSLNAITHIDGHENVSTPSIGITLFNDSSVSVRNIIKQADTAMYVAKKQGKNSIEFFWLRNLINCLWYNPSKFYTV